MSRPPFLFLISLALSSCQEKPRPVEASTHPDRDGGAAPPRPAAEPLAAAPTAPAPVPLDSAPDAGARDADALMLACGGGLRSCWIRGVAGAIRAAERPVPSLFGSSVNVRGVLVTLDRTSPPACAIVALRDGEAPPRAPLGGAAPPALRQDVDEIFLALPAGTSPPFAEGEALCGSVHAFWLGDNAGEDALLARPDGTVLYARSEAMPRGPSPLPGWTFKLGPLKIHERRSEDHWWDTHDMQVVHGTLTARIPHREVGELRAPDGSYEVRVRAAELRAPDGSYEVRAFGYRTSGPPPPWLTWAAREGYGFTIVRTGP